MRTEVVKRVYIEKPKVGTTRSDFVSGSYVSAYEVAAVGPVLKDIAGREFYELLLISDSKPGEQTNTHIAPDETQNV